MTRRRFVAPRPRRRHRLLALQLAVALACLLLLRLKWPTLYAFVVAIDHGDVLFADFVNHYYPTVTDGLRHGAPAGGFFYPAGFAAMLSPLALVGATTAKVLWAAVELGCLAYVATVVVAAAVPRRPVLALLGTALTVTSIPVLHNLKWGQVSLPILAVTSAAFLLRAQSKENEKLPAALLGIAAGIKGYPLVFVGWFVARRDLRFVGRAAAACVVTLVLLPAIVMGPAHALFFQRVSTGAVMGAADGVLRDFNSQYAPAVLGRYEGGWDATSYDHRAMGELGAMAALVLVAALVVLVARSQAPRIAERRDMLGFVLIACTVPFWLRTSWSHYFVHLPLAQVLLAGMLAESSSPASASASASGAVGAAGSRTRARDALVLVVLVAPSVFLSNVLGLFATEGWWYYANAGSLFFANALVLLAYAGVIVDAHVRFLAEAPASASAGADVGASGGVGNGERPAPK